MKNKDKEVFQKRLKAVLRHLDNVRANCLLLGERLIEKDEADLGLKLIANGYVHDNSKLYGVEWIGMHDDVKETEPEVFYMAVHQHTTSKLNMHHPEYWGGIEKMPRIFLAEMVCDWAARSSEFGNDLREWIKDVATKKFKMKVQSKVYKEIKELVDILLDKKFS